MSSAVTMETGGSSGFPRSRRSFHILDIQLDTDELTDREDAGGLSSLCHTEDIGLHKFNEVPHFLQYNCHIHAGYTAYLSGVACIRSIFLWTNETVNIWSHLLGFWTFFGLMILDNLIFIPMYGGTLADHLLVTAALICFQFCMACSCGYHTFKCHSERTFRRWLCIDQSGICVGLIGCYLPSVHFGFYCLSLWRDIYLFTSCSLCLLVLYLSLHMRSHNSKAFKRILVPMYCCLAGFGTLPAVHWVYLNGGFSAPIVSLFFYKIVVMYFLGALGMFFYASKFPECLFPGRVDFIGSSHQWWHSVVALSFLWWHNAGGEMLQFRASSLGACDAQ